MEKQRTELSVNELRAYISPESIPFETTATLEPLEQRVVGQERAIDAIKFGMGMKKPGYNIFIAGPAKAGLTHIARTFIENQAKQQPTPPDWCYVYNFKEPDQPRYLKLSAGLGKQLKKDMEDLVKILQAKIPEVFESEDYRVKEVEVHQAFEQTRRELMEQLAAEAKEEGFLLQFSQVGMMMIPANEAGEPMTQDDMRALGEETVAALRSKSEMLQKKMKDTLKKVQEAEVQFKDKHTKLDNEVALFIVGQLMDNFEEKYREEAQIVEYMGMVQDDILQNIDDFKKKPEMVQQQLAQAQAQGQGGGAGPSMAMLAQAQESMLKKYEVNILIDNSETHGAPVIIESNPAYPNVFGSIERQAWFGALFTDHTMIKPGAIHKANGGYLVLKAIDLLRWGVSYEALKRALQNQEIKIEDMAEMFGMMGTRSIRPEAIPLDLKIILTGDTQIYQVLYSYDDAFQKLFKVKAHMDSQIERNDKTILEYSRMISQYCKENDLKHLDQSGVARVVEYGMERTDDQEKLTLELREIGEILMEADYFAGMGGSDLIRREHVNEAIRKRIYRSSLIEDRMKELTEKDIFWVETDGYKVGQVNGLSVLQTGDHTFGKPSRITATVSVGREGMVSLDRESKMSGNIHTKGLLTLSGFLKERFAQDKPISLSASLNFEQNYGMVDGDSASSTELYVLLSAIAKVPINQGIAVTGSVSQKGEIQPIGGVNQKIKGFYDICKFKGLTGKQGVMIPTKNVKNLMLDEEVVEAVRDGKFHIWPVSTIEEGIEILTGMSAGSPHEDGSYPEGTLFRKVDDRLRDIAQIVQKFGKDLENGNKTDDSDSGGHSCPHHG